MAVVSAAVFLAFVAGVFCDCPYPGLPPLPVFDRTKLAGTWTTLWWPKEYKTLYKCGTETFTVDGNHIDYRIEQYDITQGNRTINTGNIRQWGEGGRFAGLRDGWDNLVRWAVVGFSENKWLSYVQCVEETSSEKSFVLKKEGAELTAEDLVAAQAARPKPADYYDTEDYTQCS